MRILFLLWTKLILENVANHYLWADGSPNLHPRIRQIYPAIHRQYWPEIALLQEVNNFSWRVLMKCLSFISAPISLPWHLSQCIAMEFLTFSVPWACFILLISYSLNWFYWVPIGGPAMNYISSTWPYRGNRSWTITPKEIRVGKCCKGNRMLLDNKTGGTT